MPLNCVTVHSVPLLLMNTAYEAVRPHVRMVAASHFSMSDVMKSLLAVQYSTDCNITSAFIELHPIFELEIVISKANSKAVTDASVQRESREGVVKVRAACNSSCARTRFKSYERTLPKYAR